MKKVYIEDIYGKFSYYIFNDLFKNKCFDLKQMKMV